MRTRDDHLLAFQHFVLDDWVQNILQIPAHDASTDFRVGRVGD
jgi:hypothetical protein